MKKNKLLTMIILIITCIMLIGMSTRVWADGQIDLNAGTEGTEGEDPIPDISFTPETPAEPEPETPTTPETEPDPEPDPEPETQNPGSTYEDSDIPYAGPEETILMVVAFVACAIIGIYTFIKLSQYSNI